MSDTPRPRISVVLATYNRQHTLQTTLRHLHEQTLGNDEFEVIVVDDGSPDETPAVVAAWQATCRHPLHFLRHENRGPGYTQNRGIREARAPIVLLMADDIFLAPGALQAHLDAHQRPGPEPRAVLGRVLQSPALKDTLFIRVWDPWRLGQLADGTVLPYYMFWACNISLRRDLMLAHGMFRDERGRGGAAAHEDAELGHRLHGHGFSVVFAADAQGWHHHEETLEGTLRRSFQRGLNWHDFQHKVPHPEVAIAYRAYDPVLLWRHRRALRGARRPFLMGADRSLAWLTVRWLQRTLMFNRWTVRWAWLPLFEAAERHPLIGRWMTEKWYRGVVVHYFLMGCREGRRRFAGPGAVAATGDL